MMAEASVSVSDTQVIQQQVCRVVIHRKTGICVSFLICQMCCETWFLTLTFKTRSKSNFTKTLNPLHI